jgi:opacity protein-like surface antigen
MIDGCENIACGDENQQVDNITAHDPGYKFLLGYRPHRFFGFEATYYDLGQGIDDDAVGPDTYDIYGGSLAGLVFLPIDEKTKLFAKAGGFWGKITENEADNRFNRISEDAITFLFGAGGEFQIFDNFSLRGEVEWMPHVADDRGTDAPDGVNANETADIDVLFASVNLIWHFMGQNTENPILSTGNNLSSRTGFYIGGSVLGSSWDGGERASSDGLLRDNVTNIDVGAKGFIGYRFHKYAAAEVGYNYLGEALDDDRFSTDAFKAQGASFALLGILPVSDRTSIFVKGGGIYGWLDEYDRPNLPGSLGERIGEHDLTYMVGGGINFDLTQNISLRGEVEFMPDFAGGRPGIADRSVLALDDGVTGQTADVDIIATSASFIWWFR